MTAAAWIGAVFGLLAFLLAAVGLSKQAQLRRDLKKEVRQAVQQASRANEDAIQKAIRSQPQAARQMSNTVDARPGRTIEDIDQKYGTEISKINAKLNLLSADAERRYVTAERSPTNSLSSSALRGAQVTHQPDIDTRGIGMNRSPASLPSACGVASNEQLIVSDPAFDSSSANDPASGNTGSSASPPPPTTRPQAPTQRPSSSPPAPGRNVASNDDASNPPQKNSPDVNDQQIASILLAIQPVANDVLAEDIADDAKSLTDAIRQRAMDAAVQEFLERGNLICAHNDSNGLRMDFSSVDFLSATGYDGNGWLFPNSRERYSDNYRKHFDGDGSKWPQFSRPARCRVDRSSFQAVVNQRGRL